MRRGFLARDARFQWLDELKIRPYVFIRKDLQPRNPCEGDLDWFRDGFETLDPLRMETGEFTSQILSLENHVFSDAGLAMPRWVFYDCALVPGLTAGFMMKRENASEEVLRVTQAPNHAQWVPLSLFCIIPTARDDEWVAHNLSSINSALSEQQRLYGLGFLTKAFGLWYGNIRTCIGMTQWKSPAIKLHSHYGDMEILTSYTPSHSYSETLTYRLRVNVGEFDRFFTGEDSKRFRASYKAAGIELRRDEVSSLIDLQRHIEEGRGPYFLDAYEVRQKPLDAPLSLFTLT